MPVSNSLYSPEIAFSLSLFSSDDDERADSLISLAVPQSSGSSSSSSSAEISLLPEANIHSAIDPIGRRVLEAEYKRSVKKLDLRDCKELPISQFVRFYFIRKCLNYSSIEAVDITPPSFTVKCSHENFLKVITKIFGKERKVLTIKDWLTRGPDLGALSFTGSKSKSDKIIKFELPNELVDSELFKYLTRNNSFKTSNELMKGMKYFYTKLSNLSPFKLNKCRKIKPTNRSHIETKNKKTINIRINETYQKWDRRLKKLTVRDTHFAFTASAIDPALTNVSSPLIDNLLTDTSLDMLLIDPSSLFSSAALLEALNSVAPEELEGFEVEAGVLEDFESDEDVNSASMDEFAPQEKRARHN